MHRQWHDLALCKLFGCTRFAIESKCHLSARWWDFPFVVANYLSIEISELSDDQHANNIQLTSIAFVFDLCKWLERHKKRRKTFRSVFLSHGSFNCHLNTIITLYICIFMMRNCNQSRAKSLIHLWITSAANEHINSIDFRSFQWWSTLNN